MLYWSVVSGLTCSVHLDDLKDEVKRSVLAAALGSDDPCSQRNAIGGVKENGEEQTASDRVGDYYWIVTDNTFYAKKDGAPTTTDYDFYIRFEGKEPAVWVEDVPERGKECEIVKDTLQEATKYQNYDLKIYIGSTSNVCLGDYGSAKGGELLRAVQSNAPYYAYATSCAVGAILCNGAMAIGTGGLTLPKAILSGMEDVVMCGAVAAGLKHITPMIVGAKIGEDSGIAKQMFLPIVGAGIGTAGTYYYYTQHSVYRFVKNNGALVTVLEKAAAKAAGGGESAAEAAVKQAIPAILGTKSKSETGILQELANAKKTGTASKYTSRLKKMAKIARDAGEDVLAKQLDDLAEAISKGNKEAIEKALQNVVKTLSEEETLSRLAERLKALKKGTERGRTQAFVCGVVSQSLGAIAGSITAISQVIHADVLAVQIVPRTMVSIGFEHDPDGHKMVTAG